ncbi:hypothetical protein V2J09_001634 [Rumex salicifolius]
MKNIVNCKALQKCETSQEFEIDSNKLVQSSTKMAKLGSILVCLLITALDVAAGICGIEAEAAQNKLHCLEVAGVFSPNMTTKMLRLIANCQPPSSSSLVAVGLGMLIIGTHSNDKSKGSCGFTHHHMMFIGGILCFVHAVSCVAYYVSATAALS